MSKVINEVKTVVAGSRTNSGVALHELFTLSNLKSTLLMLHARFSNLPLELIAPLFRNVEHDLEWVQSSDNNSAVTVSTAEHFSGTENVLLLTPCSFSEGSVVKIPAGGCVDILGATDVFFDYFEDETFLEECNAAVVFQTTGLKKTIAAILLPISKLTKCTHTLNEILPKQGDVVATSSSSSKA